MKTLLKIGVCLLALLLLSVTATAAAADPEYVQVYCAAERYWEGCQVHWLGSRMPCNWPGKDMARVADGSYTALVPADAQNLIFSWSGEYSPVLQMPEDENVKYVMGRDQWVKADPVQSKGPFYVVGSGPAFASEWDFGDPANQMTREYGLWVKEFPVTPVGCWKFQVTDGTNVWGSEHSDDGIFAFIAEGPGSMEVSFDEATGEVNWAYSYAPPMEMPKMKIFCKAPESWSRCFAHWSGSVNTCPAEGEPMIRDENGLWSLEIYADSREVTFRNEQGESFFTSIPWNGNTVYDLQGDCWHSDVAIGELSRLRVVGSSDFMGSWDVNSEAGRMTRIGEGIYEVRFPNVQPGVYEFVITADSNWERRWKDGYHNYIAEVTEVRDLVIRFEVDDWDGTVTVNPAEDYTQKEETYYVAGSAPLCGTAWVPNDEHNRMIQNPDGSFSITYGNVAPGSYELKVTDGSWNRVWCDDAPGEDPGVETMTLDLNYSADVTVIFDPVRETVILNVNYINNDLTQGYRVVGNAGFMGNWDPASPKGMMMPQEDGTYKASFGPVAAGHYEFRIVLGETWDLYWSDNGKNYTVDAEQICRLEITFDPHTEQVTVRQEVQEDWLEKGYYVIGDSGLCTADWDLSYEPNRMAVTGDRPDVIYERTFHSVQPGTYEWKVIDDSWNHGWCDNIPGKDQGNAVVELSCTANVTIIFNPLLETVWAEISYAVVEGDTVYRVTGNAPFMGDWNPACHGCVMEEESPGVYEKLFTGVQPGEYDFMITKNGTWHDAVGQDGDNIHFTVSCVSDILVRFDSRSRQITVHDVSIVPQSMAHTPPFSITHVADLYNRLQNGIRTPEASALDFNRDGKLNILDVVSMYTQVRRGTAEYEA